MALSKKVKIRYDVDTRGAKRGLTELGRSTDRARDRVRSFGKTLAGIGVAAAAGAAAAAAGLLRLAESSANTANEIAKTSRGLGVATDEMQRLAFAASRETTLSIEGFNKSIAVMTTGLEDAAQKGTGPVAEGLQTLGISVRQLDRLGIEGQIGLIADSIGRLPNEQQRAAVSAQLFGRRNGPEMANLLRKGSDGIAELGDEAERMGLVLDRKALKASEDFVDSMSDVRATVKAVARDVGIAATPAIKDIADGVKEWTIENRQLIDQELPELMETAAAAMREVVDTGADAVGTFNKMAKAAEGLGDKLGPVGEKLVDIAKFNARGGILGFAVDQTVANDLRGGLGAALQENRPRGPGVDNPLSLNLAKEFRSLSNAILNQRGERKINEPGGGGQGDRFRAEREAFNAQLRLAEQQEAFSAFAAAADRQRNEAIKVYNAELARTQNLQLIQNDRVREANAALQRRDELLQNDLQRQIQLAELQGNPAEAFALEQQQFEIREEALRRQLELETEVGERERIEDQLAQVRHERSISRIQEEQRAREQATLAISNAINSVSAAEQGAFQLSGTIAAATIQGEQRKKRVLDGIKAAGLFADGTVAAAQAAIAYASGNIPQGIALTAAAANAFAQGAVVAAGNARGGGGGGGAGTSAGASLGRGAPVERAQFNVDRGAPLSVREEIEGNPNNTGNTGSGGNTANVVQITGPIQVFGKIDDDVGADLRKQLMRSERSLSR